MYPTFGRMAIALVALVAGISVLVYSEPAPTQAASTFVVSIASDPAPGPCTIAHCSLREAIKAANANPDVSIVNIPDLGPAGADTLILTRTGALEDANVSGDLDILTPVTIKGMGAGNTVIDGNGAATLDRVVHVACLTLCTVKLQALSLTGGAGAEGAGLFISSPGDVTLTRLTAEGNDAAQDGGAVRNEGSLYVENSTFSGNSAGQSGGGLSNDGTTQLVNATVEGNTAARGGGASNGGDLTVANGTFHGNMATGATNDDGGGAIFLTARTHPFGTLNLHSTTIANNHTGSRGGGIGQTYNTESTTQTVVLRNSLVADNTANVGFDGCGAALFLNDAFLAGSEMGGVISTEGHNVDEDGTCGGDIVAQDPGLGSLASNGGFVQTVSVPADSVAVDAADPAPPGTFGTSCLLVDARGMPRTHDGDLTDGQRCDIGAYELATCLDPFSGLVVATRPGLTGTSGPDTIVGTPRADEILALGGNDVVCGGKGNDRIRGAGGNDSIAGEDGNDALFGDAGADQLDGADGKDIMDGGASGDLLFGGNQGDTVKGGTGNSDNVQGEGGADKLSGGGGSSDSCDGGTGGDAFLGADAAAAGCESDTNIP
ncbi:MAG: choice-of-anchor Q domain-containing protein [Dehalococcoidia bacterium]